MYENFFKPLLCVEKAVPLYRYVNNIFILLIRVQR